MGDLTSTFVDFSSFAVVSLLFAEVYSRIKIRWGLRRVERAVDAFSRGGKKTSGSRFIERVLIALVSILVRLGEDDKYHLTKVAKIWGVRILSAVGELVKVRGTPGGAPGGGLGGLDLGALDMDQLIGVGIGMLPKKQQGLAAMVAGVALPLLKQFTGGGLGGILGGKAGAPSKTGELVNPLLKELGK